jgi:hypothetical protein
MPDIGVEPTAVPMSHFAIRRRSAPRLGFLHGRSDIARSSWGFRGRSRSPARLLG